MEINAQIVELLVQAGLVGIFVAIIIFGFRWYDRGRTSDDKRIDSDKEITLAMIEVMKQNATAHTLVASSQEKLEKSLDKNTSTVNEMHKFMKNLNGKLGKATQDTYKERQEEM